MCVEILGMSKGRLKYRVFVDGYFWDYRENNWVSDRKYYYPPGHLATFYLTYDKKKANRAVRKALSSWFFFC